MGGDPGGSMKLTERTIDFTKQPPEITVTEKVISPEEAKEILSPKVAVCYDCGGLWEDHCQFTPWPDWCHCKVSEWEPGRSGWESPGAPCCTFRKHEDDDPSTYCFDCFHEPECHVDYAARI